MLQHIITIRADLDSHIIDEIAVLEIAGFLKKFPPTLANRYRSLLVIIFKHAVANGLCHDNPAEKTLAKKIIKKRKRLNLEEYMAIYNRAEPWLKNAMDLGLQTLQRREEIVDMKFSDIKNDYLHVIQKKTEKHGKAAHIRIKIESPLKEIIERCRDSLLSPYLVHRRPDRFNLQNTQAESKKHITQLTPNYLTKAFTYIRDQLDIFKNIPLDERPTFHEIRSLGIKLYEDKGIDAQMLAGTQPES